MQSPTITTVNELKEFLHLAMMLEHATIPPYLLALYSIKPGKNLEATQIIRVVAVEEMLHLTLAANVLNAIGGTPDLTKPGFVPLFPAYLPDGEHDFQVNLQPFSQAALQTFLKIERPSKAPVPGKVLIQRESKASALAVRPGAPDLHYYSIGDFYTAIEEGIKFLHHQMGESLFLGDKKKQVPGKYFYSGGGKLTEVTDLKSALNALGQIIEQGEGNRGRVYGEEGEMAHYYRFQELLLEQHYNQDDVIDQPTGSKFKMEWDEVYQFKVNARLTDYEASPELHAAAAAFNDEYRQFLGRLTQAFNGQPELLEQSAVPNMFTLRNRMLQLIHNPIPGMDGVNAAPTFEL